MTPQPANRGHSAHFARKVLFVPFAGIALALSVASVAFACGSLLGTFKVTGNGSTTSVTSTGLDTLNPADPVPTGGVAPDCSGGSSSTPYGTSTSPPCTGSFSFTLHLTGGRAVAKSLLTGQAGTVTIETGQANLTGYNPTYLPNSAAKAVPCGRILGVVPAAGTLCPDDQHGVGTYDVSFAPAGAWLNHTDDGWGLGDPFGKPKCINADRENAVTHIGTVTIGDSSFTSANEGKITAAGPPRSPSTQWGPFSYSSNTATFTLPVANNVGSVPTTVSSVDAPEAMVCISDTHGQFSNMVPLTVA